MLNEELLSAWLHLSSVIDNHRLADVFTGWPNLPYNELVVCGLLASGQCRTASELCAETRILKSQMNAILRSLERKGVICRHRSQSDRRQVELRLLPEGEARYADTHRQALVLVDRTIGQLGEDQARTLVRLLEQVTSTFDAVQKLSQ